MSWWNLGSNKQLKAPDNPILSSIFIDEDIGMIVILSLLTVLVLCTGLVAWLFISKKRLVDELHEVTADLDRVVRGNVKLNNSSETLKKQSKSISSCEGDAYKSDADLRNGTRPIGRDEKQRLVNELQKLTDKRDRIIREKCTKLNKSYEALQKQPKSISSCEGDVAKFSADVRDGTRLIEQIEKRTGKQLQVTLTNPCTVSGEYLQSVHYALQIAQDQRATLMSEIKRSNQDREWLGAELYVLRHQDKMTHEQAKQSYVNMVKRIKMMAAQESSKGNCVNCNVNIESFLKYKASIPDDKLQEAVNISLQDAPKKRPKRKKSKTKTH